MGESGSLGPKFPLLIFFRISPLLVNNLDYNPRRKGDKNKHTMPLTTPLLPTTLHTGPITHEQHMSPGWECLGASLTWLGKILATTLH